MSKTKKYGGRILSILLGLLMVAQIFVLPVSAMEPTVKNADASNETASSYNPEEDSTFVLKNSDVQISDDDYLPESAYISEIEASEWQPENDYSDMPDGIVSRTTVGDPMVYLTQKWLNQEYGDVPGFGSVPENGKTGWDTIYGLTRALQIELGITSLANNFGPTTQKLYAQNPLRRQDGVTDKKFAILQGALWCKGYSPGYYLRENADGTVTFDEIFNENVEKAVIQLKKDAGFINPDGVVTVNLMKALLSMDAFKLLSSYGGDVKVREMQQKLNRKYEAYTGLTPCDGVYGRNTNKAVIYALQAEEGLPTSVANGNFGNTTKKCCPQIPYARNSSAAKNYYGSYYSSSTISAMTELVQFALYVNGFGDGVTDGIFDSGTREAIRNFQDKYAIPETGIADKTTWLSLFISCGDTDRSAKAADCATILTAAKAKSLYDNGYRYIGRYLTGTYNGGISKAITKSEAQIIFDAGLNFFPIYQTSARSNSYFTEAQGTADAKAAIEAASKLGIPKNTIIYFAVDFDCMDYQITSNIIPYFRKVHEAMSKSIYRTGIYGTRNACTRVSNMGYACSSFVGDMSTGFSGNLGFSMPDNWAFDQFKTTTIGSGAGYLEIDKDGFSGKDHGVSYLNAPTVETTIPEISFGNVQNDTLIGPTVNMMGNEVPLFEMPLSLKKDFFDGLVSVERNYNEQTIEISIGLAEVPEEPKVKTEAYRNIKKMINTFGQSTSRETWNNFQKMRSKLAKKKLDFGFEFDATVAGIIKFKETDNGLQLIESGLLLAADATGSLSYPTPIPVLFLKFELEGSLKTGFSFVLSDAGGISPKGKIDFSLTPKLGLELKLLASAYAGLSGTLDCSFNFPCTSFENCFEASINASVFLEIDLLLWQDTWKYDFPGVQLYPRTQTQNLRSINSDSFKFIDPIKKNTNMYSRNISNAFSENMPIYCAPKITSLGNGKMLMVYIDDAQNRTAENRNILMYSIFDGTNWSTPQKVLDDGTGDFSPEIYSDGNGGAHIIWQNAKKVFSNGISMNEMSTNLELYYSYWNGTKFVNTIAVTDNDNYEFGHKIVAHNNDVSIVWQQNYENNPLSSSNTNAIYRRQFTQNKWNGVENVASNLSFINTVDTGYNGATNIIAYTAKTSESSDTINDLEVFYFDGTTSQITDDNVPDYSVTVIDNQIYWISNGTVYSITNGQSTDKTAVLTGIPNNISEIRVIQNNAGQKALIWLQEDNGEAKFYGSRYNNLNDTFGAIEPLSKGDDFVRGWEACMLPNGKIELSYCKADKTTDSNSSKLYGQIDLIQKSAETFTDISVSPIITYNGDVTPNNEITISADVYNSGSESINQFDISLCDTDGNIIKTLIINQDLAIGQRETLEFSYTLPKTISKTNYVVRITPHNSSDIMMSDNEATFTIGYSDITIKDVQDVRNNGTRKLEITIANQGYETIETATFKILSGSSTGETLQTNTITKLSAGAEIKITYNIPQNILNPIGSSDPQLFYLALTTSTEESDYGNNTKDIYIFSDCKISLTDSTGGTVTGSGNYAYGSSATVIATPAPNYIFAGWYENGKLLDAITEEYTFDVLENRSLEAHFIPNNLAITDIEIFGDLQTNNTITFTIQASGGYVPYQWDYYIYKDDEICYSSESSTINFIEWNPTSAGDYTIKVRVTDESGFNVLSTKQFSII